MWNRGAGSSSLICGAGTDLSKHVKFILKLHRQNAILRNSSLQIQGRIVLAGTSEGYGANPKILQE
jgi:hypothetical protein